MNIYGAGVTAWVAPPFITRVLARFKAGGGGGGASSNTSAATGGGGGGGYSEGTYSVVPNTSYPVTVGAAGTAGTGGTGNGGNGGASSFASFLTANGGSGSGGSGGGANAGGGGGTATGGQINVPGISGDPAEVLGGTYRFGSGGAAMWVGPTRGAGMFPGGGGSGAINANGSPGGAGIASLEFGH